MIFCPKVLDDFKDHLIDEPKKLHLKKLNEFKGSVVCNDVNFKKIRAL